MNDLHDDSKKNKKTIASRYVFIFRPKASYSNREKLAPNVQKLLLFVDLVY